MGKFITSFNDHNAYQQKIFNENNTPNISLCKSEDEVHYKNKIYTYNGHEYIEIGGMKWATMNLGANSVTDTGLYFQWGDTQGYTADQVGIGEGQKNFELSNYKYYDNENYNYTKYNNNDGLIILQPSDDAIYVAWGGNWRMPTVSEYQALIEATNIEWTNDYQGSGVAGLILTDKTNIYKKLFFPTNGHASYNYLEYTTTSCHYWTSSIEPMYYELSKYLAICESDIDSFYGIDNILPARDRYYGLGIRGIIGE